MASAVVTATITNTITSPTNTCSSDLKPIEKIEGPIATTANSFNQSKEQEMISTIANIKKEMNVNENVTDYTSAKKMPLFIKKEPGDETPTENNNSSGNGNNNTNTDTPSDIKLAHDIKTENKCGLDLTDVDSKHDDVTRSAFETHSR